MPKKFSIENPKAATARARKSAVKEEQKKQREKEIEDKLWKDDDKNVLKKQQRKDEKEKKKQEQLEKKQELKMLLDNEMNSVKSIKSIQPKITRAHITMGNENKQQEAVKNNTEAIQDKFLTENLNRFSFECDSAHTVDEAISILSSKDKEVDNHPEKRLKAAYITFEAENLPRFKLENPTLRLSQIKQLLRREWTKSPSNPLNNL